MSDSDYGGQVPDEPALSPQATAMMNRMAAVMVPEEEQTVGGRRAEDAIPRLTTAEEIRPSVALSKRVNGAIEGGSKAIIALLGTKVYTFYHFVQCMVSCCFLCYAGNDIVVPDIVIQSCSILASNLVIKLATLNADKVLSREDQIKAEKETLRKISATTTAGENRKQKMWNMLTGPICEVFAECWREVVSENRLCDLERERDRVAAGVGAGGAGGAGKGYAKGGGGGAGGAAAGGAAAGGGKGAGGKGGKGGKGAGKGVVALPYVLAPATIALRDARDEAGLPYPRICLDNLMGTCTRAPEICYFHHQQPASKTHSDLLKAAFADKLANYNYQG